MTPPARPPTAPYPRGRGAGGVGGAVEEDPAHPADHESMAWVRTGEVDEALDSVVVRLARADVDKCFRAAAVERPADWLAAVTACYTGGGLGQVLDVRADVDKVVEVVRRRAEVEGRVLDALGLPVVRVETDRLGPAGVRALLAEVVAARVRPAGPAGADALRGAGA